MVLENIPTARRELIHYGALAYREHECMSYAVNIDHAFKIINWLPITDLQSGLCNTIKHYSKLYYEAI